jgi:rare lipoprotein A
MIPSRNNIGQILIGVCLILFAVGCASTPKWVPFSGSEGEHALTGEASWYGPGFNGKKTANGERFRQNDLTAAHKTLPFNTVVKVTNLTNGRTVKVRINDRGPFIRGRIIDLSKGAAKKVDMIQAGIAPVRLEIIQWGG